jgi:hypothetical protein
MVRSSSRIDRVGDDLHAALRLVTTIIQDVTSERPAPLITHREGQRMFARTRQACAALIAAGTLAVGAPAAAQIAIQDGLVNVVVGDVTVLQDVNVAVAAQLAAQLCGIRVGPVTILGTTVDRGAAAKTICRSEQGPVRITQN